MGGRCAIHAPSCGRQTCLLLLVALLPPQAWPLLIKVYWAIRYGMRYVSALASPNFLFPSRSLSALGDFLGGPSCSLWMLFYWICPLVTPTPTLLRLGLLLPLFHHHSLTHSTPPGMAVLRSHQALEASTHYFGLGLLLPLSTATCSFTHPPPTGFFHNTWLAGCMYGSFGGS